MMQAIYSGKSPRIRSLVATGEKTMTNEFKIFSDDPKYASQNPTDLQMQKKGTETGLWDLIHYFKIYLSIVLSYYYQGKVN